MGAIEVLRAVKKYYAVDVKLKDRTPKYSHSRQVAMYLLRQETDMSYLQISRYLGLTCHTTAMHGIKKVKGNRKLKKDAKNILKLMEDIC